MALVSPGVEVTVIDESNYIPAATNSVPYFLIATAENKVSGTGVGVAAGTLEANAGRVYLITSQRDLAATFGNPFFYKTAAGTPINGYELNEYGLLAAYSALGISNRAYVQRANVDLTELTASLVRPTGDPADGTYWLDTAATSWGIFQWNQTTGAFSVQTPIVITNTTQLTGGIPSTDVGNIGDYAVVATNVANPVYYKTAGSNANTASTTVVLVPANSWVLVGTDDWKNSWPTVQGSNSVTGSALTAGNSIIINDIVVNVPASPNNNLLGLAHAINSAGIPGVKAETDLTNKTSNKLWLYADSEAESDDSSSGGGIIVIAPESTAGLLTTLGITATSYLAPSLQQSPNFTVPRWRVTDIGGGRPTGSVWNMTTSVNQGADIIVKKFDAAVAAFVSQPAPIYENDQSANRALDPTGGGRNIAAGSTYTQYNVAPEELGTLDNNTFTLQVFERLATGATVITGDTTSPSFTPGETFTIQYSVSTTSTLTTAVTATLAGSTAAAFVTAVSAALPSGSPVSAAVTSDGAISFTHSQGGVIVLNGGSLSDGPIFDAGLIPYNYSNNTGVTGIRVQGGSTSALILSNWVRLGDTASYTASDSAPSQDPADGRNWYYSAVDEVDIMIQNNGSFVGYRTVSNDVRGFNLTQTDPAGPIVSASAPTQQSDETALVEGDLWIDTSNLELYPVIKRWQSVDGVLQWVTINNTDQTTENGILFADARWAPNGTTNPITDAIPTITSLLSSSYLDIDAPDAALYPEGMLLFNTRRSGFNVKSFQVDYFNATDFAFDAYSATTAYVIGDRVLFNGVLYVATAATTGNAPTNTAFWATLETNTWLTVSGNRADGSPYMGRQAVRQIVVAAMKSAIDTQDTLREEQVEFNLLACPQYPELIPNMVALNNERSNTGFVVGDTPLRLAPTGTAITAWATNAAGEGLDSEAGLVTADAYLGTFYPSCQTTDLTGSQVVQPPSHMMIRTIIRSDEVAFPWLAPAGVRRGVVDNAERLGYVDAATGEFISIATGQGLRDTLYENRINPITFIPGVGITNYGNKTEAATPSALDRINVARLVAFIRGRLEEIGKTFVFEPNDQITRNEISNAIEGLMVDLVAKRGIYDYLVVCDESNNTPARIDRNELYVDIAIEPVKAIEFIYIPLRIKNTGEISSGQVASSATV